MCAPLSVGPLELLLLQPTPFCNIDCSYCYLANRHSKRQLAPATLEDTFRWVFSSGLVQQPFTVLWHAGEPLSLPISYYESATAVLNKHSGGVAVAQTFQTNATLIDERWCEFFLANKIHPGVSVDGPPFLHDRHRVTRRGQATSARVLRGIRLLKEHGIPFGVITVLTNDSLDFPDEMYDFYLTNGITSVAFNVEEVEGEHTSTSLEGAQARERLRRFYRRFFELALSTIPPLSVREFEKSDPRFVSASHSRNQVNKPWAIVNVDCDGNFSTYSPELLGVSHSRYGRFALGNVRTHTLTDVLACPDFQRTEAEIAAGVERCRSECEYFAFCGGGVPANKLFENGTFASTETVSCRLHTKLCVDATFEFLELRNGMTGASHNSPKRTLGLSSPSEQSNGTGRRNLQSRIPLEVIR